MGNFSWIKSDTHESVVNSWNDRPEESKAKLILPDGTEYVELAYGGYGVFGGRDFFALVAELNGYVYSGELTNQTEIDDEIRDVGIDIYYGPGNKILPKVVSLDYNGSYDDVGYSETCPDQGDPCDDDDYYNDDEGY